MASGHTLARTSVPQSKRLLKELVNLRADEPDAVDRFQKKFGHLIPSFNFSNWTPPLESAAAIRIRLLRDLLVLMWKEPDERAKEYRVLRIRQLVVSTGDLMHPDLPPPTPFEDALRYLYQVRERTRCCGNPQCRTPYFFANRRNQRYCSEACTRPAQREFKRRWWAKAGSEWREKRVSQGRKT